MFCAKLGNLDDDNFCDENRLEVISCHYDILRTESLSDS